MLRGQRGKRVRVVQGSEVLRGQRGKRVRVVQGSESFGKKSRSAVRGWFRGQRRSGQRRSWVREI